MGTIQHSNVHVMFHSNNQAGRDMELMEVRMSVWVLGIYGGACEGYRDHLEKACQNKKRRQ